jgi:DNA polymerase-3 subunit alpha
MQDYLKKLHPESLDDLAAMNALYRPGPLDSGMINVYIDRKQGREKIEYLHPDMEPVLKNTFGVIVFQEQVLQLASKLAGFSLGKADILRKAMGKKIAELMAQMKKDFINGCVENGISKEMAKEIFHQIETFARYGFNKSHSVGYAYLAYQTAYLKAHYPREFMASLMTSEMGNTDRIIILKEECRNMQIEILPPDINRSYANFNVEGDSIRFGLAAIKHVGMNAVSKIIQEREANGKFKSIFDFTSRCDLSSINKRMIESMVMAGAFDSAGKDRGLLFASVEDAVSFGQSVQIDRLKGQTSLFGEAENNTLPHPEPRISEEGSWSRSKVLSMERAALGFYISGHPMEKYRPQLRLFATTNSEKMNEMPDGVQASLGGIITRLKINTDKRGRHMGFVGVEDFYGSFEAIVFSDPFEKYKKLLINNNMLLLTGRISKREEEKAKLIVNEIKPLESLSENSNLLLKLTVSGRRIKTVEKIKSILEKYPGDTKVVILLKKNDVCMEIETPQMVNPNGELMESLSEILSSENLSLSAN